MAEPISREDGFYWVIVNNEEVVARWYGNRWWFAEEFPGPWDEIDSKLGHWIVCISERLDPPAKATSS